MNLNYQTYGVINTTLCLSIIKLRHILLGNRSYSLIKHFYQIAEYTHTGRGQNFLIDITYLRIIFLLTYNIIDLFVYSFKWVDDFQGGKTHRIINYLGVAHKSHSRIFFAILVINAQRLEIAIPIISQAYLRARKIIID